MPFASFSASKRLWELGGLYPVGAWKHLTPLGTYGNPSQGARTFRFIGDGELGDPTGQSRLGHVPLALRTVRALRIRPSPLHALTDWDPPGPRLCLLVSDTCRAVIFVHTHLVVVTNTLWGRSHACLAVSRGGSAGWGGTRFGLGSYPLMVQSVRPAEVGLGSAPAAGH